MGGINSLFTKEGFVKDTFILTMGTGLAQLIPMLFYPILGRIYSPTEFGLLATIMSITSIIAVLSTGRYEASILITETKQDAVNIILFIILLSLSVCIVSYIVLMGCSSHLAIWLKEPMLEKWLFICPISAFSIVIYNCYNEWCVRNKYFAYLSINKISNSGFIVLSKFSFGISKLVADGLIWGDLLGRVLSAIGCVYRMISRDGRLFVNTSFKRMRELCGYYKDCPQFILPGALMDTVVSQLPVLLFAGFYGGTVVGFFSMSMALLSIPASVLGVAISDVFRQKANEIYVREQNFRNFLLKTLKISTCIIVPIAAILMFVLPSIFTFVLGDNWRMSGIYAMILLPYISINFLKNIVGGTFIITEKFKQNLVVNILLLIASVSSLTIGCFFWDNIIYTLVLYTFLMSVVNLIGIILSYKYSKSIELHL